MLQARLEKLLLHEGQLGVLGIHPLEHLLAFKLKIRILDGTKNLKMIKH